MTQAQFLRALTRMGNGKATGLDGIPVEVYKRVGTCQLLLYELLCKIWDTEEVTIEFARASFVMLHKKGSTNDPTKYRCIGLLTHAYKVLAQCLQERLVTETQHYLSD